MKDVTSQRNIYPSVRQAQGSNRPPILQTKAATGAVPQEAACFARECILAGS